MQSSSIAILIAFVAAGCASAGKTPVVTERAAAIHPHAARGLNAADLFHSDPNEDLNVAWAYGDRRFLMVRGFATYIPGVESQSDIVDTYGAQMIEATGDDVDDALERNAWEYASIYNRLLLRRLRQRELVPATRYSE